MRMLAPLTFALVAGLAAACSHPSDPNTPDTVGNRMSEDRAKAKAEMDQQITALDADIAKLDEKAHAAGDKMKDDAKAAAAKSRAELKKLRDDLTVARDKVANATESAWEETRGAFRKAYDKTKAKVKELQDAN